MSDTKPESLACPSCGEVLKSTKTIGLPDSQTATCKRCTQPFSLGQARGAYAMTLMDFPSPSMPASPITSFRAESHRSENVAAATVVVKNYNIVHSPSSSGNAVYALLSFLLPGLGQLCKGNASGLVWFFGTLIAYVLFIVPGLIVHVLCVMDAAKSD